jgi:hypothetical protein
MDKHSVRPETLAGDGIAYAGSREERMLRSLEQRYHHDLLDVDERQEVYAQLLAMRARARRR